MSWFVGRLPARFWQHPHALRNLHWRSLRKPAELWMPQKEFFPRVSVLDLSFWQNALHRHWSLDTICVLWHIWYRSTVTSIFLRGRYDTSRDREDPLLQLKIPNTNVEIGNGSGLEGCSNCSAYPIGDGGHGAVGATQWHQAVHLAPWGGCHSGILPIPGRRGNSFDRWATFLYLWVPEFIPVLIANILSLPLNCLPGEGWLDVDFCLRVWMSNCVEFFLVRRILYLNCNGY